MAIVDDGYTADFALQPYFKLEEMSYNCTRRDEECLPPPRPPCLRGCADSSGASVEDRLGYSWKFSFAVTAQLAQTAYDRRAREGFDYAPALFFGGG